MRALWLATAGLLLMLGLCVAASCYVRSSSEALAEKAAVWQQALEQEDEAAAETAADAFSQKWQQIQGRLGCLIDHSLLREAEEARSQVRERMRLGQFDEAAAEAARLRCSLTLMQETERSGLDNIL